MKSLVIYIFFLFLIFNNSDSHAQWVQTNGLNNRIVYKLAISGDNIFSVTDSGAYRSTNNGTDWTQLGLNKLVYAIAVSGNKVFAIDVYSMFFSTDNGTTWTKVNIRQANFAASCLTFSGTNIIAGTVKVPGFPDGAIYLSTDYGVNWTQLFSVNGDVESFTVSGTNVFASIGISWPGYGNGAVYRSNNYGEYWEGIGFFKYSVYCIAINENNIFAGTLDGGVFLSSNNGTNWSQVNNSLTDTIVYALVVSGINVFAGTYGGGVFLSTNNGTIWTQVNNGLTHTLVRSFAVNDSYIFAGTDNGVWRRPLSELVPVELSSFTANTNSDIVNLNWNTATETNNRGFEIQRKSSTYDFATVGFVNGNGTSTKINNYSWSEKLQPGTYSYRLKQFDYNGKFEYSKSVEVVVIPKKFSLEQNFPNPFNPSTTIRYNIPFECNIKLNVFNSLGENVREFNIGTKSAGLYDLNFNSNRLTSGVYFYSITATSLNGKQNFRCTKKMILMK
jgi:photosystem II stability/assembly factor-like uncharacterized protein